MTLEHLLPLIGFVAVMSGTPGPNNLMLMAAGANVGWRPCLPHLLGIAFGCQALLWSLALGLGGLLAHYPALNWGLRLIGAGFLLTLAWRLATTRTRPGEQRAARPLTSPEHRKASRTTLSNRWARKGASPGWRCLPDHRE